MVRSLSLAVVALAACGPGASSVAVHTGAQWRTVSDGTEVTVYRDNPPLQGWYFTQRGGFAFTNPRDPSTRRAFAWTGFELAFDRTVGATPQDARNPDGWLAVAPVGSGPQGSGSTRSIAWHSNGLQLAPGAPVSVHLRERVFVGAPYTGRFEWRDVPGTDGRVVLAASTRIVPVRVTVVAPPGGRALLMDRARAELWFDGRTVDRGNASLSSGGSLSASMVDHDPRSALGVAADADPAGGRAAPGYAQDPDAVWSVCGERYDLNLQFRLIDYREVASDVVTPNCTAQLTRPDSGAEYCVGGWARANLAPGAPPALDVVFVDDWPGRGVAEAFPGQGIIYGVRTAGNNIGSRNVQNTLAHELGHLLGGDTLFHDGASGPENLMADLSRNLTRAQCQAAYDRAAAFVR